MYIYINMITNWSKNEYNNWRGHIIFIDDKSSDVIEEQSTLEWLWSWFY
jgi:hypothetical protein